jgi:hypothetical protein
MHNERNANISLLFKGNSRNSKIWVFFVALVIRGLVVVIATASLKAWQTKTLHVFPHSLLILALRFTDWTVILFPQTALTLIVCCNGRTLCFLSGAK